MNENIRSIMLACKSLGITYKFHDHDKNILSVELDHKSHMFVNWSTPFNSHSSAQLCDYKDCTIKIIGRKIRMPRTKSYLDPECASAYKQYGSYRTTKEILTDICKEFSFPLIVKRNRGYQGMNVFFCRSHEDVKKAVNGIFDKQKAGNDYICLAQEYLEHRREFRTICVAGHVVLAYEKDNSQATFVGNLSPLHFKGAIAKKISDKALLAQLEELCSPIFSDFGIFFCGADIIEINSGLFVCLEINSSPMLHKYIFDNGINDAVEVYKYALQTFKI